MNLAYFRKRSGLTQGALADALGLSKQAISNYETGEREPDLMTLVNLSNLLGVTTDELLGHTTNEQNTRHQSITLRELLNICPKQNLVIVFQFNTLLQANINIKHSDHQGTRRVLQIFGDRPVTKMFAFAENCLGVNLGDEPERPGRR